MASVFQSPLPSPRALSRPPAPTPRAAARRRARFDALIDPALHRALAEPVRLRLLSCLLKCARPCSVTEIAACCSIDFSMVARHLATMARAGLLDVNKSGRTVWYQARGPALAAAFRRLADAIDELAPSPACTNPGCSPDACAQPDARDPLHPSQARRPRS